MRDFFFVVWAGSRMSDQKAPLERTAVQFPGSNPAPEDDYNEWRWCNAGVHDDVALSEMFWIMCALRLRLCGHYIPLFALVHDAILANWRHYYLSQKMDDRNYL